MVAIEVIPRLIAQAHVAVVKPRRPHERHPWGDGEEIRGVQTDVRHGGPKPHEGLLIEDAHALRPSKANIVNPARLAPLERSSVCEQCHLTGEARVPDPSAPTFRPGLRLEDSVAIFTRPATIR